MRTYFTAATSFLVSAWAVASVAGETLSRRIPDEYEAVGGPATGLGNTGAAALGGISGVRINPAILPLEDQYSVNAGYNWPTSGRDFYQLGIVDTTTSKSIAAGVSYTGFSDEYQKDAIERIGTDAPIHRRATLALAHAFDKFSIGLSGQFVAGYNEAGEVLKGTGMGLGVAALLTPTIRLGAAGENLSNRKIDSIAPRTLRAGMAYLTLGGSVSLNLDYRQRMRVAAFEGELPLLLVDDVSADVPYTDEERMVFGSFTAKIYDVLRLMGAYGQAVSSDKRRTLAGGVGLVHQGFSLSYNVIRPYLPSLKTHSAVQLSLMVTM